MIVERAYLPVPFLDAGKIRSGWPFEMPCVAALAEPGPGLLFTKPVTYLVGENGSGKSTLVEAIAEAFGLDAAGLLTR